VISLEYIAGFFDGEGSIFPDWGNNEVGVTVGNRVLEVLTLIEERVGGTPHTDSTGFTRLKFTSKGSMRNVLTLLLPHLIIKRRQAELALVFLSTPPKPDINKLLRHKILLAIEELNKRTRRMK